MRIPILTLLSWTLLLSASAQLPVVPLQIFRAASSTVPTGATIWYRPDDVTNANTANMVFWPDHSGNGYNGQSTTPWTNNILNGWGSAYGSGSAMLSMTNAAPVSANVAAISCFTVISIDTTTAFDAPLDLRQGSGANQRFFFRCNGSGLIDWEGATHDGDTIRTIGPVGTNPSGFFLAEAVINYSAGTGKMWTNGVLVGSTSSLTAANTSNTSSSAVPNWIKFDQSGGKGRGVEFLFYTNSISDATRTNVIEPYFRNKYNLW